MSPDDPNYNIPFTNLPDGEKYKVFKACQDQLVIMFNASVDGNFKPGFYEAMKNVVLGDIFLTLTCICEGRTSFKTKPPKSGREFYEAYKEAICHASHKKNESYDYLDMSRGARSESELLWSKCMANFHRAILGKQIDLDMAEHEAPYWFNVFFAAGPEWLRERFVKDCHKSLEHRRSTMSKMVDQPDV